jgi:hypothetical protein
MHVFELTKDKKKEKSYSFFPYYRNPVNFYVYFRNSYRSALLRIALSVDIYKKNKHT